MPRLTMRSWALALLGLGPLLLAQASPQRWTPYYTGPLDAVGGSDVVAIGEIVFLPPAPLPQIGVQINGPNCVKDRLPLLAQVQVLQLLGGIIDSPNISVDFSCSEALPVDLNRRRLFLLRREGDHYVNTIIPIGVIPAEINFAPQPTPLAQAIATVSAAIVDPDLSDRERIGAFDFLDDEKSGFSTPALEAEMTVPDRYLSYRIICSLLRRGDANALPVAAPLFASPRAAEFATCLGLGRWRALDVPALAGIITSPTPLVRTAAATALGTTGADASVPLLARALDDSDIQVRLAAVRALAHVANHNQPMATLAESAFRQDEAYYLAYWKEWATEHQPPT